MIPSSTIYKWARKAIDSVEDLRPGNLLRLCRGRLYGFLVSATAGPGRTITLELRPVLDAAPEVLEVVPEDVHVVEIPKSGRYRIGDLLFESEGVKVGAALDEVYVILGNLWMTLRPDAKGRGFLRRLPAPARRAVICHLRKVAVVVRRPDSLQAVCREASTAYLESARTAGEISGLEADEVVNAASCRVIQAFAREYGACWVGHYGQTRGAPVEPLQRFEPGDPLPDFQVHYVVPRFDPRLRRAVRIRDRAPYTGAKDDVPRVDAITARIEELGGYTLVWS